jgi:tRNA-dihydrouridine synthase
VLTGVKINLKERPELVLDVLERYVELMSENFSPQTCVGKIKQLASQMCRGYSWRKNLCMVSTLDEQKEILARARDGSLGQNSFENASDSDDQTGMAEMDCNTFQC